MAQEYNNLHFLQYRTTLEGFIGDMELPIYAKKIMLESILYDIDKDFNKAIQKENENFLIQEKGREQREQKNQYSKAPKELKAD